MINYCTDVDESDVPELEDPKAEKLAAVWLGELICPNCGHFVPEDYVTGACWCTDCTWPWLNARSEDITRQTAIEEAQAPCYTSTWSDTGRVFEALPSNFFVSPTGNVIHCKSGPHVDWIDESKSYHRGQDPKRTTVELAATLYLQDVEPRRYHD